MKKHDISLGNHEELKQENDFLKLKMMLERGAHISSAEDLPPELENEFLKSVAAYEDQFRSAEKVKLNETLGRPVHFRPVAEIPDENIESEWITLHDYMNEHGIDLSVCSPNVSARELYRFTTEELFQFESDNISLPGMMTCFIYDEFYPDHKYDNQRMATDSIKRFFEKLDLFDFHFAKKIRLNNIYDLSFEKLSEIVKAFKAGYKKISKIQIDPTGCDIDRDYCAVKGNYSAIFKTDRIANVKNGEWLVELSFEKEYEIWRIDSIQLEGIAF